ncbi:hypothetical protein [Halomonas aquatica]|uniref:Uncharacterized protein n=1 Tax=Halomonas aquatica TaxID=3151123 RepID=A0ABV1ND89_9GAMM
MSSYAASQAHKRSLASIKRQQQPSSSRQARTGPKLLPQRLMSISQWARDMGISRNDLVGARSRGNILMGMHREDVEHIMGSPDRVNQETLGGQQCHHLHWRDDYEWTDYIRLCNGRVDHLRRNNTE